MNPMLLKLMSGPLMAAVRYGVTAGAAAVAQKGWIDGQTAQAGIAFFVGLAATGIGMMTSTKSAAITKVNLMDGVAVVPEDAASRAGIPIVAPH